MRPVPTQAPDVDRLAGAVHGAVGVKAFLAMRSVIPPVRLPEGTTVFCFITVVPLPHFDGKAVMAGMFFPVIREVPSGLSLGIRLRGVNHVLFGTPLHGGGRYGSTRLRVDYRTCLLYTSDAADE